MCLAEATCLFLARCRSFSDCSPTKQRARLFWSAFVGVMSSSAITVARSVIRTALPIAPAFSGVVIAAATQASPLAPSWNVPTHRCRFGSGQPTWSQARRRGCRLFSFSGNSDCPVMRRRFKSFISSVRAWCAQIRTELAAGMASTLRSMKLGWEGEHGARGVVSMIRLLLQAPLKSVSAYQAAVSTNARVDAMLDAFDSPLCQTAVQNRSADSSRVQLNPAQRSLPMTGAAMPASPNEAMNISPSPRRAIRKFLRNLCRSSILCFPISRPGCAASITASALQSYLNEFTFRFNRRFYPFNAFRSLLGIASDVASPTYAELYAAKSKSQPTTSSGLGS